MRARNVISEVTTYETFDTFFGHDILPGLNLLDKA